MKINNSGIGSPYWYEWEIGIIECLKMLYDDNVECVIFQDPRYHCLDDVVIEKKDGSINVQVKYTDIGDNITFSFLFGSDNGKKVLKSLAEEWSENASSINEVHLCTNKPFGPKESSGRTSFKYFVEKTLVELRKNYNYEGESEFEKKTICDFKKELSFLDDNGELFVKSFYIDKSEDLAQIAQKIEGEIQKIIGVSDKKIVNRVYDVLNSRLMKWTTSIRGKEIKVRREDIYEAIVQDGHVYEYDFHPQRPIFPSRISLACEVEAIIRNNSNKYFFISGEPGIGKTNFVNYLSKKENSIIDFRFYTYKPADKSGFIYSNDYGNYKGEDLWKTILYQIRDFYAKEKKLYQVQFPLVLDYIPKDELRKITLHYLQMIGMDKECVVFIDGIDHAARVDDFINSTYLAELPHPDDIPHNVKIVVVGQPNYSSYPEWLISNVTKTIVVPGLSDEDVISLLPFGLSDGINKNELAKSIISIVGRSTLNVLFALKEVEKHRLSKFDEICELLCSRKLNQNINDYYKWIIGRTNRNELNDMLLVIFAFSNYKLSIEKMSALTSADAYKIMEELDNLYPLIVENDGFYYPFHNDVRLFIKTKFCGDNRIRLLVKKMIPLFDFDVEIKHDILIPLVYYSKMNPFDILSVEYLKEFFLYNFPFKNLVRDMEILCNYIIENSKLEHLPLLSVFTKTLFQIDSLQRYDNDGSNPFINFADELLDSEKYIYKFPDNIEKILSEISSMMIVNNERANMIYDTYFQDVQIGDMIKEIDKDKRVKNKLYDQLGYIFRYKFNELYDEVRKINSINKHFFEGWVKASIELKEFDLHKDIIFNCTKHISLIEQYLNAIIKEGIEDNYDVVKNIINKYKVSIFSIIDAELKYRKKDFVDIIYDRHHELFDNSGDIYHKDLLYYYHYLNICLEKMELDDQKLFLEYKSALANAFIKENDRGYTPSKVLFKHILTILKKKKECRKLDNKEIITIIETIILFTDKYGTGSAHDCGYFEIKLFIYDLIMDMTIDDVTARNTICDLIIDFQNNTEKFIPWKLMDSFLNRKEDLYAILIAWFNNSGKLWKNSCETIVFEGKKICEYLLAIGKYEDYKELEWKLNYKSKINYLDHKDYTLIDLTDWFECVEDNDYKLTTIIPDLLGVNDYACMNGNNRSEEYLIKKILMSCIKMGPTAVDAVFACKNTPENFYYWREAIYECLVDSKNIIKDIDYEKLQILFNAWGFKSDNDNTDVGGTSVINQNLHEKQLYENRKKIICELQSGKLEEIIPAIKNCMLDSSSGNIAFMEKMYDNINDSQKELFIFAIVEWYFQRRQYSYYYDGAKSLLLHIKKSLKKDFFIKQITKTLELFSIDNLYSFNQDIEILTYIIFHDNKEKALDIYNLKMAMHKLWIGSPSIYDIQPLTLVKDNKILTWSDFVCKLLMKSEIK